MLHTRNVAKVQKYNSRKFGVRTINVSEDRPTEYAIFFHKTTAFAHTMHFFKIRRNGFRRIGTEPHFRYRYSDIRYTV